MAKFNVMQKQRRAAIAEQKRAKHGDPHTRKLKMAEQPLSVSGKRKRKLFKKWRREHKEALEKGVITMEDVQLNMNMTVDHDHDGSCCKCENKKKQPPNKLLFHLNNKKKKKSSKLKVRQLKKKDKKRRKSASIDAMEE
ncbi:hypothetical protein ACH5RR_017362 [Cinchona calisaya]|uniref:Uncharacterized protein n=1 Tax=Cinchona calisaya TaxID=153742 RepID=A0ABD2ZZW2_9GENT